MSSAFNMADPRLQRFVLAGLLRQRLSSFVARVFAQLDPNTIFHRNWHIDAIAWHLEEVRHGRIKRLIVTMPPRSLKSITASVAFPAFVHGHHPERRFICVSYASELAAKLQNDYRIIVEQAWYRSLFPGVRIKRSTESEVTLTATGGRLASSVGGVLTGRGADIIVIDDPLKAGDAMSALRREAVNDWYRTTLISRLNDKNDGAIIIVTQRLHIDDLVGHVTENDDQWVVLNLPAIARNDQRIRIGDNQCHLFRKGELLQPIREPLAVLERMRREGGADAFSAQYLQEPVPPGGHMFLRAWVKRYIWPLAPLAGDHILQSWDTASKEGPANDWSVCTTWRKRDGLFYLIDVFRQRVDYPNLKRSAIQLGQTYKPRMILVEDMGVGSALIPELRLAGLNVRPVVPKLDMQARAAVQTSKFEGGRVYLPDKASWLSSYQEELFAFPGARHDDQVDSTVNALEYEPPRTPVTITTFNNLGR
jgi:predicted phage terminase large subunit-like protein